MGREHLMVDESESSLPTSFADSSLLFPISAFEIRFNKLHTNEIEVQLLEPNSNQRRIPLPFQKRDKIRSSTELDRREKNQCYNIPSKELFSIFSSSDMNSTNQPGERIESEASGVPFDEILIPSVYKRMKMNHEISENEKLALADLWYGQTQNTTLGDTPTESSVKSKQSPDEFRLTVTDFDGHSDGDLCDIILDKRSNKSQEKRVNDSHLSGKDNGSELNSKIVHLKEPLKESKYHNLVIDIPETIEFASLTSNACTMDSHQTDKEDLDCKENSKRMDSTCCIIL
ncbi:hypothetical protein K7432_004343 [Basidiobolus ranarum]|uniref:Uncharacterized protein n=1 Tax=Basidiobolus ranarum TaxID=34480 RepID=A0ABR2WYC8_9FUNG